MEILVPTAVKSKLRWLLSGLTKNSHSETNVVSNLVISGDTMSSYGRQNNEMLKRFWEVESWGIVDTECEVELVKGKEEVVFKDRHYEVGLPWKEGCLPQPNHYGMCVTRLQSLDTKLKKEPNLLQEYDNIQEQRKKGIIEIVPTPNEETLEGRQVDCKIATKGIHYSPHHAVIREHETTKVRIVYDGSAKNSKDERSLNDCLEVGENYIPHIFTMLTNFR